MIGEKFGFLLYSFNFTACNWAFGIYSVSSERITLNLDKTKNELIRYLNSLLTLAIF